MNDQRVFFEKGKLKQLLEVSRHQSKLTWKDYATLIGVSNYNVLRASYLSERNSLPTSVLRNVIRQINNDEWKSWIVDIRDQHWGQSKGGKIALKSWHAKMRLNSNEYWKVQSQRFRQSRSYKYTTSAGYDVRSLYELLLAENLISNLVPHEYERMIRCGNHIFFPDFFLPNNSDSVVIEVCGFRSGQNWTRLRQKFRCYKTHQVAEFFILVYLKKDRHLAATLADAFHGNVQLAELDEMSGLFSMLQRFGVPLDTARLITESEALKRCRRIDGKRVHWQRLLSTIPREQWIETLEACGLPHHEVRVVRSIDDLNARLIKATCVAKGFGFVPREALVEMIAGTYNGAAGDRFGSMANLIFAAESAAAEKFT